MYTVHLTQARERRRSEKSAKDQRVLIRCLNFFFKMQAVRSALLADANGRDTSRH